MSAQDDVISGRAWDAFCDTLKQAGRQILRPEAPVSELDRAEGWRYLTRLLRIGLEMHLECADPDFPAFFMPSHETGKIGADNPDNLYLMARINGRNEYVLRGTRGTVSYLSIGTQKGGYETDGKMEPTGFIDARDLQLDAEGRFEVIVSAERPAAAKNWLRIEPASNAVLVRQTFLDRKTERPATITIARAGSQARPEPLSAERIALALQRTAGFVDGTATVFANWAQSYLAHPNQLPLADQKVCQAAGGDPNIVYYHSYWQLADDEALVIHLPRIPDCRFWNLQINNWWMESLDYRYHRAHFNAHSAKVAADGSVTMVLAHRDPGVDNWLETAGHDRGTMCLRWVGSKENVDPELRIVKSGELKKSAA
ncbi:MAG: DUF1214 domain-containing protein [Sinimarinibacterium flocculans]|uniref:DUF1214 domain-containing protein n=1 Tax=Sinimarinibacterium flocculans TaxID=985250 RepID=UPI003C3566E8